MLHYFPLVLSIWVLTVSYSAWIWNTPRGWFISFHFLSHTKTKSSTIRVYLYALFTFFTIQTGHIIANHLKTMGRFIYILDSSTSSSFTFWSSQIAFSSRSNWTGIWTGNSNGTWTDKQSSHFSTAKEISVKATFFFM